MPIPSPPSSSSVANFEGGWVSVDKSVDAGLQGLGGSSSFLNSHSDTLGEDDGSGARPCLSRRRRHSLRLTADTRFSSECAAAASGGSVATVHTILDLAAAGLLAAAASASTGGIYDCAVTVGINGILVEEEEMEGGGAGCGAYGVGDPPDLEEEEEDVSLPHPLGLYGGGHVGLLLRNHHHGHHLPLRNYPHPHQRGPGGALLLPAPLENSQPLALGSAGLVFQAGLPPDGVLALLQAEGVECGGGGGGLGPHEKEQQQGSGGGGDSCTADVPLMYDESPPAVVLGRVGRPSMEWVPVGRNNALPGTTARGGGEGGGGDRPSRGAPASGTVLGRSNASSAATDRAGGSYVGWMLNVSVHVLGSCG